MKTKFIQALAALILPIVFICSLIILNLIPLASIDKYGFGCLIGLIIALLINHIFLKKTKKTYREVGFVWERKTPKRFLIGFLIGTVITITMLMIVFYFSELKLIYNKESNIGWVLLFLLAFFPLAFMEEIIFRGQAFIKMNTEIGIWPAQILFALLFTWYHDFTGLTFLNQLTGPGIWALIYGITAIWTKGLAFPTGLHMALNVVLALIGQKDARHAIWNIEFTKELTEIEHQPDNVGFILQVTILVIGIILTECYRRNRLKHILKNSRAH
jgi:hypothetical protein